MLLKSKVAPRNLIQADFKNLRGRERLDTSPRVEDIIFMQSMEGRAHNGAGSFHKRFYVNTSIDDIVKALGRNPTTVKQKRQELIDEIMEFVRATIKGKRPERLVTRRGTPILGMPIFKNRTVNADDILRGLYLGGLRDDANIRREAEKRYKIRIGFGTCFLVNTDVMSDMGLDGESLAHQEHEGRIKEFMDAGLIIKAEGVRRVRNSKIRYFYIRQRSGPGQSDDAAIVATGLLYKSVDVALGVFLADAVDTLEKHVPKYSDQDDEMAFYIGDNFKKLNITMDQVYELAYLSATPEGREDEVPDSSLRYLLTIDPKTGQSTIESHLNFIEGKPFFPMAISYKRILITSFYEYIKERIGEVAKTEDLIPVSEALGRELDIPVKELAKKKVIVVSQNSVLSKVLSKLKEKNADVIIVQDDRGKILGVIDPNSILTMLERRL